MKSARILCLAAILASPVQAQQDRPELEMTKLLIGNTDHEVSGLYLSPSGRAIVVADSAEDTYLYLLIQKGLRFHLKKELNIIKLSEAAAYQTELLAVSQVAAKDQRFDLEGITACDSTYYLINERVRHVLAIEDGKSLKKLPIDFLASFPPLFEGGSNAGFEGIAADCANKTLYVAKEREPRAIFKIDMTTWKVLEVKDFTPSDRSGQKVINFLTGNGLMEIGSDISDLFFDNGYLYALERNTWEIAKIDPKTFAVVSRVSYLRSEHDLYQTGEPFGIAESLSMNGKEIWIGVDNNKMPLSGVAQKQYQLKGNFPAFMILKRPGGF